MNRRNILIVVSVVLVVVVALAVSYVLFWAPPSKQNFVDAKADAEKITTYEGSKLLQDYIAAVNKNADAGQTGEKLYSSVSDERNKIHEAVMSREELSEKISKSPVVRDEEVMSVYTTYNTQEQKYSAYMHDYSELYPYFKSSFTTCLKTFSVISETENLNKLVEAHDKAAKPCLDDLSKVEASPVEPLSEYATEFKRIINERRKAFDAYNKQELDTAGVGNRIKELSNDFSKLDPAPGLKEYVQEARFNGELTKLVELLDKKAQSAN